MDRQHLTLDLDGEVFDAVAAGPESGEPVLLLHGFPQSSWAWRFIQPPLAHSGYRTVAPDLRGYSPGARPADPERYRIARLVDDVVALADRLGWGRFHLVGHDWGGVLAWHAAGRLPQRIATLTSVATPHPRAMRQTAGQRARSGRGSYIELFRTAGSEDLLLADGGAGLQAGLVEGGLDEASAAHHVARAASAEAMVGMLNWYRAAHSGDADNIGPITCPTLYLWPDADGNFDPAAVAGTADQVSGPFRQEVLVGAGHWVLEEAPTSVVSPLLEHLEDAGTVVR